MVKFGFHESKVGGAIFSVYLGKANIFRRWLFFKYFSWCFRRVLPSGAHFYNDDVNRSPTWQLVLLRVLWIQMQSLITCLVKSSTFCPTLKMTPSGEERRHWRKFQIRFKSIIIAITRCWVSRLWNTCFNSAMTGHFVNFPFRQYTVCAWLWVLPKLLGI